jgi:hypothetical protein
MRVVGLGFAGYFTASGTHAVITFYTLLGPVPFETDQYLPQQLRPLLHTVLVNYPQRGTHAEEEPSPTTRSDPYEQLARLGQLRDSGVISEAEFQAKKAELLSRI